ncbi:MAG: hypothetical protein LBT92_03610 [Rickettsiales bacterium]|jgi:hypothetical protein|nr:hypothetical protein [Rickettsiales bacterium]
MKINTRVAVFVLGGLAALAAAAVIGYYAGTSRSTDNPGIEGVDIKDPEFRSAFKDAVSGSMMDSCVRVSKGEEKLCSCYRDEFINSLSEGEWDRLMTKRADYVLTSDKSIADKIQGAKSKCDTDFVRSNMKSRPAPFPADKKPTKAKKK